MTTCTKPDHDEPRMTCGHPLPCPWHTIVIDVRQDGGEITIPIHSGAIGQEGRLVEIADAIGFAADVDLEPCDRKQCNCPRYLHKDGTGKCSGCGDCPRFVG